MDIFFLYCDSQNAQGDEPSRSWSLLGRSGSVVVVLPSTFRLKNMIAVAVVGVGESMNVLKGGRSSSGLTL